MQTTFHSLFRAGGALAAITLALGSTQLSAANNSDAFPTFDSYIKISGQAPDIKGDSAAFQARNKQSKNGGFGIEDLRVLKDLSKTTSLTVEGRALAETEDYLLGIKLVNSELGTFDVGYKRFRTFSDGVGGFFPVSGAFQKLNPQDLHLDRGTFWAEMKIARPDMPEFTLRYTNGTRNGQKDSISWGDSDNAGQAYRILNGGLTTTGVTATSNSNATVRKFLPSYFDVDERLESLEASVKHKVGKTTAQLSFVGDKSSKNNFHYVSRFTGERLGVLPGATVITTPVVFVTPASDWLAFNNQVTQSTFDIQETKSKGVNFTSKTELSPKLDLEAAANYQDVAATFSGDRWTVSNSPVVGDLNRVLTAYPVRNLTGKTNVEVWVAKLGLNYKVSNELVANGALRYEKETATGNSGFDVITASAAVPPVFATTSRLQTSDVVEKSMTPVVDLRYTGIKDLSLYVTASDKIGDGTDVQTPAYNPATTTTKSVIYRDVEENKLGLTVGGNWRATSKLSLRAEPFYKKNKFQATGWNTNTNDPLNPTLNNNYQFTTDTYGAKLTAIAKPADELNVTARYIYEKAYMTVTGYLPLYPEYASMDGKTHDIGVTLDWNPNQQFFLQANADLVYSSFGTVSLHNLSVSAAGVIPANRLIQNANNNYTTVSVIAGTVLTKTDDLQVQFTHYQANNYNPQIAIYTMPYGAGGEEFSVSAGLKHKFSDKWIGHAKLGYVDSKNETTGGRTNFRGPLAYVSLDYAL